MYFRPIFLVFAFTLLINTAVQAQPEQAFKELPIFTYVEQMPEPAENVVDFLGRTLRYPEKAKSDCIQGRVMIRFVVQKDGRVTDVVPINDQDTILEQEAIRVVSSMKRWKPAVLKGENVPVYYTMPISFRLEGCPTADWYLAEAHKAYEADKLELAMKYFLASYRISQDNETGYNYAAVAFSLGKKEEGCRMISQLGRKNYQPAKELGAKYCP